MKILHHLPGLDAGGIERLLLRLISETDFDVKSRKVDYIFVIHDIKNGIVEKELDKFGFPILRIPPKSRNLPLYIYKLIKIIRYYKIDILHVHQNYSGWLALLIGRLLGVKTICHGHQYYSSQPFLNKLHNLIVSPIIHKSDYKIACTIESSSWFYNGNHDLILPNSFCVEDFKFNMSHRDSIRSKYNIKEEILYGHIGRFSKQKNQKFLIQIFNELKKIDLNAKLMIIGEGEIEVDIKQYATSLKLNDIIWVAPNNEINRFFSSFDKFLLPSLWEGLGIVAVESQASGLPTIISNVLPEDLNLTDQIFRISFDDTAIEWAKKINEIPLNLNRIVQQETVKNSKYNIKKNSNLLLKTYEKVIYRDF
jgi:glycosyltransferase involved in cell wall biosynthesis